MAKNFQKMVKKLKIQGTQQTPKKINKNKIIPTYTTVKLQKKAVRQKLCVMYEGITINNWMTSHQKL